MSRSLFAGMTDYDHQSLDDIKHDLREWIEGLQATLEFLVESKDTLDASGYWKNTVDYDLVALFLYSMKFYQTSFDEILEIVTAIDIEVESHHAKRLNSLGKTAIELNHRFGQVWHRGKIRKDYGNPEFMTVEHMYARGRDMAVDMMDLANLAARLESFVGRKHTITKEKNLLDLIDRGEGQTAEFKVSACWNEHSKARDGKMFNNIAKSIASFMNSENDAKLLIGVADDGRIVGLENDFQVADAKKQNQDGFELFLNNKLSDTLGNDITEFYDIDFSEIDGKKICVVEVKPASRPVFYNDEVYIRNGNQNRRLTAREAVSYCKDKWPRKS